MSPNPKRSSELQVEEPSRQFWGEKAVNTTKLTYVSAGGLHVTPMVIFKVAHVNPEWSEFAPLAIVIVPETWATSPLNFLLSMGRSL